MPKKLAFLLVGLFAALTISFPLLAQDSYTVSARSARVRAEPNTTSEIVVTYRRGAVVQVLETVEGARVSGSRTWYRIDVSGQTGYIHSSLVTAGVVSTGGGSSDPISTPIPSRSGGGASCGGASTCGEMGSCEQAYACLAAGNGRLDRDNDGVPCESICPGG